jgi:hypothetical protein
MASARGLAVDTAVCRSFESAEFTLAASTLKSADTTSCNTDADCSLVNGIPGYYCGSFVNAAGAKMFTDYVGGDVFDALESRFKSLGCRHLVPPCAFPGDAVCKAGVCGSSLH